jgi:PKD repeat protein
VTVIDDQGESGAASITINIENNPPVADARANPTSGSHPLTVNFDGSYSYDPDGNIVSYYWNFGDNTWDRTARPTHSYRNPQSYTAVLTVTDDRGITAKDEIMITVGNKPPVAVVMVSPQKGKRPLSVTLNGLQSYDPDDTDLTFTWEFGDGTSGSGMTTGHTYEKEGTYRLSLIVTDPQGASDTTHATIEVEPPFPWLLVIGVVVLLGGGMVTLRHFRKPLVTVVPGILPSECRIPEPEVHVDVESGVEYSGGRGRDQRELPDISVEVRSGIWKEGEKK